MLIRNKTMSTHGRNCNVRSPSSVRPLKRFRVIVFFFFFENPNLNINANKNFITTTILVIIIIVLLIGGRAPPGK